MLELVFEVGHVRLSSFNALEWWQGIVRWVLET